MSYHERSSTCTGRYPALFVPHPHLSDEVNRNICQSEIEGGVFLNDLGVGTVLEVETQNRFYRIQHHGNGQVIISGHPQFCPQPVLVDLHGSTWGGSMLKVGFVGRGMHLEFRHPHHGVIHTSRIEEVRELNGGASQSFRSWESAFIVPPPGAEAGEIGLEPGRGR